MISIEDLCFSYNNSSPYILNNVNIFIPKGSYVSIIGENGSCKSTLIKLILKLLNPNSGKITLHSSKIGYVPQRMEGFNSQFPITVSELLNNHRRALNIKDKSIIDSVLNKVNMSNFKNKLLGNLSGGQQQRVFIARALMGLPEILILDEPSTGIDHENQLEIYALIKELNLKDNVTVISVEHNMGAVLNNSSHVLQLCSGDAKFFTIDEFKNLTK
ncbi:metal ABC transporter ATP-binding protein [Clostridium hydrogeniformans]|uniref:metal ABC transporter ATP-binding protein n=1 Tax=Clostridium hydrogeniformans TaxID=349933 RepID=UPI0004811A0F|nr:metal ABC transporter ATP-binding protein [Clostridium hydrogeniformans]